MEETSEVKTFKLSDVSPGDSVTVSRTAEVRKVEYGTIFTRDNRQFRVADFFGENMPKFTITDITHPAPPAPAVELKAGQVYEANDIRYFILNGFQELRAFSVDNQPVAIPDLKALKDLTLILDAQ